MFQTTQTQTQTCKGGQGEKKRFPHLISHGVDIDVDRRGQQSKDVDDHVEFEVVGADLVCVSECVSECECECECVSVCVCVCVYPSVARGGTGLRTSR